LNVKARYAILYIRFDLRSISIPTVNSTSVRLPPPYWSSRAALIGV